MLKASVVEKLNTQINMEFYSSNLYLQMGAWADQEGFEGAATFLRVHADEEMMHMRKLFQYVLDSDALPVLGAIDAPPTSFESLRALFQSVYAHEQEVTRSIAEIVHFTFEQKDLVTFNFLQWYVAEQHEEEKLARTIMDKFKVIGDEGRALYFVDQEIARLTGGAAGAAEAAAE